MTTTSHDPRCDRGTITPETNEDDYECPGCGEQLGLTCTVLFTTDGRLLLFCCEPCAASWPDEEAQQ